MLVGADVQILDAAPPATSLTDTATLFMAGLADRGLVTGPLAPSDAVHSYADLIAKNGALQSYNANEYASAEAFFAEGGSRLYFSRQVGPAAAKASITVPSAGAQGTFFAKSEGAWGNALDVTIAAGVLTVRENGVLVETSTALTTVGDLQAWVTNNSTHVTYTPSVATTTALTNSAIRTLAGGGDDRTNITDTQRQTAIDRFGKDLGPGQVCMPGDARTQAYTILAQHALDRNRFAYGDMPDASAVSTVTTAAAAVRALGRDLARHIQLLEPWLLAPGTAGTTRTIPPCGVMAGLAAKIDAGGNPNRAVAGRNAVSRFATAPKYIRTDTERSSLADAGVTPFIIEGGRLQPYDDVTPVDGAVDPEWLGAAGNRLVMRVISDALEIAKAHMFGSVSGRVDLDAFRGDLEGMLMRWKNARALYGETPADAFRVETGDSVNTPTTIAAKQLRAALALKISPNARQVIVQITNTPLTEVL